MLEFLQQDRLVTPGTAPLLAPRIERERAAWSRGAKRALDLLGVAFGAVVLWPVFLAIALAIRLDSRGPALFRQTRVGLGGVPFEMYKFRSMHVGVSAEQHKDYVTRMICEGGEELRNGCGTYKLENDPRITRVGAWLRRTSLDELAQLINVARGEMSLVGPRPPLAYEVALYSPRDLRRLTGTPGMTGLWQVSGRNETTFEEMVDLDISYIENRSLVLDLQILARTVGVLIRKRGA